MRSMLSSVGFGIGGSPIGQCAVMGSPGHIGQTSRPPGHSP